MAFLSVKRIHGKKRYYLEKSVRLPNGRVQKYSVYLSGYVPRKRKYALAPYRRALEEKARGAMLRYATEFYQTDHRYDAALLRRLEETKLGYAAIRRKLTRKQLQDIIDRFTVNFTYESNAIEGNSLTIKDVTMLFHEQKLVPGKDLREIYETLNTRAAMQLLFMNKLKISEADIRKLHRILVKNTGVAFGYKQLPNFLLGRTMRTTPPERVAEEMQQLIAWYHANPRMHPLRRAVIFHAKFEQIHPFEDGNGRVGRLLVNAMLQSHGYPPLIIRKTHRTAYFRALEAFDYRYPDKLHRFFIEKYRKTYEKFFGVYMRYLPQEK